VAWRKLYLLLFASSHVLMLTSCVVGWVPKAFVSSRSERFDAGTQQKPEDFMDDEVAVVILRYLQAFVV